LAPRAPQYVGLKQQLRRYRDMACRAEAPASARRDLERATAWQARCRPSSEGGAANGAGDDHGVPVAARIQQIAINIDRWRWLPEDLGTRYLNVNIPAFRLDVIENGRSALGMKVVVGKKDNPTPVLADEMTSVVFSPYWNIPPDIVQKETLPHVLKD